MNSRRKPDHGARTAGRTGLTILEVLVSLSIFLGAMAAIGQLISSGSRAAVAAQLQSQAMLRCESVAAEVAAGIFPLQATEGQSFADDASGQWTWSLALLESPHVDLIAYEVTVRHVNNVGRVNAAFSLQRQVRDPQLYELAAEAELAEEEAQ